MHFKWLNGNKRYEYIIEMIRSSGGSICRNLSIFVGRFLHSNKTEKIFYCCIKACNLLSYFLISERVFIYYNYKLRICIL